MHSEDVKNELLNEDLLNDEEYLYGKEGEYDTPLKVADKYRNLPSLD